MKHTRFHLIAICLLAACTCIANAEPLYFGAPPREGSETKSRELYQPVINELSRILGRDIQFKYQENFFKYGSEMRKDGYDIIFDGPHFATWRINHLGHQAVVALPGHLKFMVITKKAKDWVKNKDSLIAKKICGPSIPNLATLSAQSAYSSSLIRQPTFEAIPGGMKGSMKAFKNGRCDAVVLRDNFYLKKITPAERKHLKIVFVTKPQPNQTITASERISGDEVDAMKRFFISNKGKEVANKMLNKFSKNRKEFINAYPEVYKGLDELLIKYAWGWDQFSHRGELASAR